MIADRTRRRGISSLIETMVAMSLIAVLFATGVGLIGLVVRLSRGDREAIAATIAEDRLASDLRADVHAAIGMNRVEDQTAARLDLEPAGGGSLSYAHDGDRLLRTRIDPAGGRRIETYRLPKGTAVRWESREREGATLVVLVLEMADRTGTARKPRPVRIEAVLGRDHRYEGGDR